MPRRKKGIGIGGVVALVAFLAAVILGLLESFDIFTLTMLPLLLVIAGLIIGFLNIGKKESIGFLVSTLVLGVGTGVFALLPFGFSVAENIAENIAALALPAAVVVALKTVWMNARR